MNIKRLLRILAVGVSLAGIIMLSSSAQAQTVADSTISQVIRDVDCTHTIYDRAVGQVNSVECATFAPKHERTDIAPNGYPILYGVYDAIHAVVNNATGQHDLVVEVAGHRFVLGVDPELRVNGNAWTLDLSNWPNTHPPGSAPVLERGKTYQASVAAKLQAYGSAQQTVLSSQFTIVIPGQSIPSSQPGTIASMLQSAGKALASTGINFWLVGLLFLGVIIIAISMLLRRKKWSDGHG